jgi:hypothetical protein
MSTIIKRLAWALPLVVLAWIALMAVVMRFSDAAPAAVIPFHGLQMLSSLPKDAAILEVTPQALTLANRAGLTRDLYDAGAWLVLPAGLTGCLPLTRKQLAKLKGDGV